MGGTASRCDDETHLAGPHDEVKGLLAMGLQKGGGNWIHTSLHLRKGSPSPAQSPERQSTDPIVGASPANRTRHGLHVPCKGLRLVSSRKKHVTLEEEDPRRIELSPDLPVVIGESSIASCGLDAVAWSRNDYRRRLEASHGSGTPTPKCRGGLFNAISPDHLRFSAGCR